MKLAHDPGSQTEAWAKGCFRLKLKLWLKIVVSAGVLTLLFVLLPWHEVREAVRRLPLTLWLAVLAMFLAGHRLGAAKWRRLVNAGRASLERADSVRFYAAGLFANICLPSIVGGDVIRAALAARATGRVEATVLGSIADRLVDTLMLAILVAAGVFFARDILPEKGASLVTAGLVATVLVSAVMVPMLLRLPLRRWPRRIRRRVGRSFVALRYLSRDRSTAVLAFTISLVVQGGFVLLNAWIGRAIGVDVPLAVWFFAWPLAKIVALVPIALGGLGVRDATLGALLVPLGVPLATGVVASLIWQSVLIGGGLLAGLYWWVTQRRIGVRWTAATRTFAVAPGARPHG
jgi:uncharacterized protein (TIRG00374 family)